jgi:RimJ/RimL family protein N-acetyltransferase
MAFSGSREGDRLLLRPFKATDFDALLAIQSRSDVARWLYWGPRNADEVRAELEKKMRGLRLEHDGDGLSLAVELKTSGEVIGYGSLILVSAEHRQGELGYVIHPDHQGQGYATDTARTLLQLGFEDFGLHRMIGRIEPRNEASARVLERLGMRPEAHFVENEYVKGEWQSEAIYAILEREWRSLT